MKYYAFIDGEQKGPFELEELPQVGVRPSTYIWHKGLEDWQKAEDDPDVCRLFRNHLYDIMHPNPTASDIATKDTSNPYKVEPDGKEGPPPTRFDRYLQETGESLPTLEEIEAKEDKTEPPVSMIGYAWLVTIFCFFPTGIVALVNAYRTKKEWNAGNKELAHNYSRLAKMWTGITFFIGLIGYALFCAFSL